MIYIDKDGTIIDFYGTAEKHFGIKLEHNVFGVWKWGEPITPEQFYAVAEPQPWFDKLLDIFHAEKVKFLTKDYADIKTEWLIRHGCADVAIEASDKSVHCEHPMDLLIDDNAAECQRWRDHGGIAYHFDLADPDPFGKFLAWWRLER